MSRRGAAGLLAAVALAAAAGPLSADDGRSELAVVADPAADAVAAERLRLCAARLALVPAADAAAASKAATELGATSSWQDLVEMFRQVSGDFRNPHQGDVVLDALARGGAARCREMLAAAAQKDADPLLRVVVLRVVARPGADPAIADVLALVQAFPAEEQRRQLVREPLGAAVAAAVDRRPGDVEAVRTAWRSLDPLLRTTIVDALAASKGRLAARALSRLLDTGVPGDGDVFRRLSTVPVKTEDPFDAGAAHYTISALGSSDVDLRVGAAAFAGRSAGPELAEQLFAMMQDPEPRVAAAAHRALEAATGAPLVRDAELWRARLTAEKSWAEESRAADLRALDAGDADAVTAALHRMADHRLHAESLATAVERVADHSDPQVRAVACRTLGRLGRPSSIRALLEGTEDEEPSVAAAAAAALAAVTRLPAPAEPSGWRAELDGKR